MHIENNIIPAGGAGRAPVMSDYWWGAVCRETGLSEGREA